MKNLQFMRVLIKVSGMHLYKIPFQCNIHSKLQTNSSALWTNTQVLEPQRDNSISSPYQGLGVGGWDFPGSGNMGVLNSSCPQVFCSRPTQGNRGKNPTSLGTRGRGSHACSSCRLLCFFTATEELSLAPKSVIPHKSLASSHIRADW